MSHLFFQFDRRKLEWCIALFTILLGYSLMAPNSSFPPSYKIGMLYHLDELELGLLYTAVGCAHCMGLHVSYQSLWAPLLRILVLGSNASLFFSVALAIGETNPWGFGFTTNTGLAFLFCGVAMRTAAADLGTELAIHRLKKRAPHVS